MLKQKRNITKAYFDFARKKYTPLINKLGFRISDKNGSSRQELNNRGLQELTRCMICYDGSSSFMTFFYGRLKGVFRHMRASERRANKIQILDSLYMASIAGPDRDINSGMMVQEYMECLSGKEHDIITRFFLKSQTTREISNDTGMVIPAVCKIKRVAIKKMRKKHSVESE